MRKLTAALCLGLMGALGGPLQAQAAEVATLDWQKALLETDAAQRSMNQFRNRTHAKQQEAESLGRSLQSMQQRFQDGGQPSQAEQQEFQTKRQRFEQLRREILQARQEAEQRFLQDAEPKLDQAVQRVIDRHDVQVLVTPQGVVHAEGDLPDLTGEVTAILNSLN
ncbi:OmpH family outer membrane protein [Halomonas elongata]|uniref:OmpH family outer membrane protein n=2 Tax=Halomonas elongata TaxID=2746 RepID=E1V8M3_HALED|nr:OmpH family outer membrane protein [Halomonas elongata]MBW5799241.1 OmpH family outer membrane protein [Halomonas elongata]MDL4861843.1 OmpH family outer membrane protein [Halomonas elongata]OBX34555.1 outer membrane protein (OmpH-like) [Halomonas elongata]RAW08357.1 OmpH family outer membrane protein [Halomonas elongata]WBF17421.1 OmpH family outer membrane protein [Halomonas elongata]